MINIRSKEEIKKLEKASEIVKDLLFDIEELIKPGVTTLELNSFAEQ